MQGSLESIVFDSLFLIGCIRNVLSKVVYWVVKGGTVNTHARTTGVSHMVSFTGACEQAHPHQPAQVTMRQSAGSYREHRGAGKPGAKGQRPPEENNTAET